MNLLIEGEFSEPPSSTYVFRDLTLYAKCFLDYEILVECEGEMVDVYWKWLKKNYAFDFIDDILPYGKEIGLTIRRKGGSINLPKLDEFNFHDIVSKLKFFFALRILFVKLN